MGESGPEDASVLTVRFGLVTPLARLRVVLSGPAKEKGVGRACPAARELDIITRVYEPGFSGWRGGVFRLK